MIDARKIFASDGEETESEHLEFDRIECPASKRPDLCAFMKLDSLLGGERDLISAAEHDEIWLDVDIDRLNEVATHDDIIFLIRCGVRHCRDVDSLAMFV